MIPIYRIWTIWTSLCAVPRKAVKFNHSLTPTPHFFLHCQLQHYPDPSITYPHITLNFHCQLPHYTDSSVANPTFHWTPHCQLPHDISPLANSHFTLTPLLQPFHCTKPVNSFITLPPVANSQVTLNPFIANHITLTHLLPTHPHTPTLLSTLLLLVPTIHFPLTTILPNPIPLLPTLELHLTPFTLLPTPALHHFSAANSCIIFVGGVWVFF